MIKVPFLGSHCSQDLFFSPRSLRKNTKGILFHAKAECQVLAAPIKVFLSTQITQMSEQKAASRVQSAKFKVQSGFCSTRMRRIFADSSAKKPQKSAQIFKIRVVRVPK